MAPRLRFRTAPRAKFRQYHSYDHPSHPSPFNATETAILSASLRHISAYGFTNTSLTLGARDAGYIDASTNLFPKGAFSLVHYHLLTQRLELGKQSHVSNPVKTEQLIRPSTEVKALTWARLLSNGPIIHKWQEALALMAIPSNLSTSLHELASLSDDILFLSGDKSVDTSWYAKRASLSTIYAATDLYMTTDTSRGFQDTKNFLDRRFEDSAKIGTTIGTLGQWVGFTTGAGINVLRSKGVRI